MHQVADQVGDLHPGQYITPRLMFPPHTLPGGSSIPLFWGNYGVLLGD